MSAIPEETVRELRSALGGREGFADAGLTLISPLGPEKRRHLCYLAEAGERRVKLRRMDDAADAHVLCLRSADLPPAFVPPLGAAGAIVFEPWIDGELLRLGNAGAWAQRAGAELGRLHEAIGRDRADPSGWIETAHADLTVLAELGALDASEAERLAGALRAGAPDTARWALMHRDFGPENMVIDPRGELRIFDNEWLIEGPASFDLGRTYHRWPLAPAEWERFVAGYASVAGEPEDVGYWILVATLFGARVFAQRNLADLLAPLLVILADWGPG